MSEVEKERSKRNFRKVKSLNLRKPKDLEIISQGIDDLTSLMKLKKILFAGEVFDEDVNITQKGEVLKNKMLLNEQAKENSKKRSETEETTEAKKKSSVTAPAAVTSEKPKEWEDVKEDVADEFWRETEEVKGDVHYAVAIKGWRDTMEDTFDVQTSVGGDVPNLFGVYDGHGGSSCANYCKTHLLTKLSKSKALYYKTKTTMQNVFTDVHDSYDQNHKDGKEGSTATTVAIIPIDVALQQKLGKNTGVRYKAESTNPKYNQKKKSQSKSISQKIFSSLKKAAAEKENKREFKFYCACAGDSRAVLVYDSGRVQDISNDHTLRRKGELERVKQSGGEIRYDPEYNEMLVYSEVAERALNVTRSIGDSYFKPWVTHIPEIHEGFITKDVAYILIASDGLWSHVRSHEVGEIMLEGGLIHGVKNLANLTNKRGCYDNCTIMAFSVQDLLRKMNDHLDADN